MLKRSLILVLFFLSVLVSMSQDRPLVKGMKITKTIRVKKGVYSLAGSTGKDSYVILIEGNNIVVDFNNATLSGANSGVTKPDAFIGVCIVIRNSNNVTIKNVKAKGYKIALRAFGVNKLTLDNCDFSYNYRKQLNSGQEKEDVSDWMSYHHNENDEWLRYGAGIYLRDCDLATIRNCKVTGGQNALMMTECDNGMIYNNDFSFNSGVGLGLYRSSGNKVMFNKMNFNVRGYSHGVYNRGQDSAGILVYEQSNYNYFYRNSVTHSGDGFFLWAGQTTMDTGEGGCNYNMIDENDFSYAPTNGIEVTFSQNTINNNRIFECDHGIWGGYSYNMTISNNKFSGNRIGIAIEHGQENNIQYNIFSGDKEAIRLWARKEQPADWGYAKNRDTRSRDYTIVYNSFNNNPVVYNFRMTNQLNVFGNTVSNSETIFRTDSSVTNLDTTINEEIQRRFEVDTTSLTPSVKNPNDPFLGNGKFRGRKNILITEWGPYDFRYPLIWNTNPADKSDTMHFDLLGPSGNWKIKYFKGVKNISNMSGTFPSSIIAIKTRTDITDIVIELEYRGASYTSVFGEPAGAGKSSSFYFKKFFQPISWEVLWYSLDTSHHNPIKTGSLFSPVERKAPFKTEKTNKLDYAWWGGIKEAGVQHTQFITVAQGEAEFSKGNYEISVTWDDAVRVYIDEKLVVNEWNPSLYKFDETPNRKIRVPLNGKHSFRVEHLELGGFASLSLKFKPIQ